MAGEGQNGQPKPGAGADASIQRLLGQLDYYPLVVGEDLRVRVVSGSFLKTLGYTRQSLAGRSIVKLLGLEFVQELFVRKEIWEKPFKNYRAYLRAADGRKRLFQISGLRQRGADGRVLYHMVLQDIGLAPELHVDTGAFEANLKARQLLKKYVSKQLFKRAQSAVIAGYDHIPNEERAFTFLFADLVSYTALAEKNSPDAILEMLNVSIGATSSIILHNGGFVDKIMGDSIFAVFEKPRNAIVAGLEIQKQFNLLNLFRVKSGQEEVAVRIGIHTGKCILGSIGSEEFMELTFIGDAVNTASRLERASQPGQVLVSAGTLELIQSKLEILSEVELTVKGKQQRIRASYINRITFTGPRGEISIGLDDQLF